MLIDLGHTIRDGMAAYPGLPPARVAALIDHVSSRARYGGKAEFALTAIELSCNTGTYLDSPWHRHADRHDVAGIPLTSVTALRAFVVDGVAREGRGVTAALPDGVAGAAVLVRTGWSARWETADYWAQGPFLDGGFVDQLVAARAALVGVDFANVDDTDDLARPAHTRLLDAEIVIVENMTNLDRLPAEGARLHCAPLAVHGAASMPVRPYAEVEAAL